MNATEFSRLARRVEFQHMHKERMDAERAARIRHGIEQGFQVPERVQLPDGRIVTTGRMTTVRLSERGREIMRRAERQGQDRPQPRAREVGFHVDVYANNRSNRDESRDPRGHRRRD